MGSILETDVLNYLLSNPMENAEKPVREIMRKPFPEVGADMTLSELGRHISKENPAVVAKDRSGKRVLVAQYDILQAL